MKKLISVLTAFAILLSCCLFSTGTAFALESDFIYKELSNGTAEITGYTGAGGNVNIPSTLGCNWKWRLLPGQLTPELARFIRADLALYQRIPPVK